MGKFRTWLETNPHNQFRLPALYIALQRPVKTVSRWVENPPLSYSPNLKTYLCDNCGALWQRPKNLGSPSSCPRCGSINFREVDPRRPGPPRDKE